MKIVYFHQNNNMRIDNKKIAISMLIASITSQQMSTISFADNNEIKAIEYKVITGNYVNFRKGAGTNYQSMDKLHKGYKVEYIGKSGSWVNIRYNGKTGYVHGDYVGSMNSGEEDTSVKSIKVVSGSRVNFRSGPSTSNSIISTLNYGTEVDYISESNGWAKIKYNGKIGYMSSKYLKDKSNNNDSNNESIKSVKIVSGSRVNFRSGPSTSNSIISTLNYGTEVDYISESNGWAKIKYNGKIGYMSSKYLTDRITGDTSSSQKADKVIAEGKKHMNKPYVWGAEGPNSFDCSGFTQYVFKQAVGVSIPRVSKDQSKFGQPINRNELKKGDLMFFDTSGSNNGVVSHVGIYMGNGQMIHGSSGAKKVKISDVSTGYYYNAFTNARRVL